MYGDSEVMSDRTPSICMGSDVDLSSHSWIESMLKDSSVFDRESAFDPFSEEASPSGQLPREIVLPDH